MKRLRYLNFNIGVLVGYKTFKYNWTNQRVKQKNEAKTNIEIQFIQNKKIFFY